MAIKFNDGPRYKAYRGNDLPLTLNDRFQNDLDDMSKYTETYHGPSGADRSDVKQIMDNYNANHKWMADREEYLKNHKDVGVSEGFNARIYDILHPAPKPTQEPPPHWSQGVGEEKWKHQNPQELGWKIDADKAKTQGMTDEDVKILTESRDMNPYVMQDLQNKGVMYSPQRQYEEYLRQQELERQRALASRQAMMQATTPQVASTPMTSDYAMHFAEAPMNPTLTPRQEQVKKPIDLYYDRYRKLGGFDE